MAVIFLQPPDPSPVFMATAIDQNGAFPGFGPGPVPRMMIDDFTIGSPTNITSINFWGYFFADSLPAGPPFLPIIHMEIYADIAGSPGPILWSSSAPPVGDFGPGAGLTPYTEAGVPIGPGWYYDPTVVLSPSNPAAGATTIQFKYTCPIPVGALPLSPGTLWLGIQTDLSPTVSTGFGWSNMIAAPPAGVTAFFSPVPFLATGPGPAGPIPYPVGHPLAGAPMDMAFELEGVPITTTTTTAPAGTTTTTAPAGTTTTAPPEEPHATWDGTGFDPTQVTFGTPAVPAIPADFFEPGSDPFTGTVELEGDPIGPEDTSTVVRRAVDPFAPSDPPGGPAPPVSIEIIALQLRSVSPITVTVSGPTTQWDVSVDLSSIPVASGQLTATKTHSNGGTFDADFLVQPHFVFTKVSGSGVPLGSIVELDTGAMLMPPLQFFGSGDWVHSVNDPLVVHAPGAQFVTLINEVIPGLPSSQVDSPMSAETNDPGPSARHVVAPPRMPTPTTTSPCECNLAVDEMPPEGCEYSGEPWVANVGLPPGDTLIFNTIWMDFVSILRVPGGTLGGEVETFASTLDMTVSGTGSLSGFSRHLSVPLTCEVHTAPRVKTSPSQSFDQVAINLIGELFGDPDFCTFRVKAGSDHGMPSPGHTLLEKLGGGDFAVDSFFDISYTIEFQGCPGSQLDGYAGTTPGASEMRTGASCLTTIPATTTAPAATTTTPPATTTDPPFTTPPPTPGTTPHPADTGPGVPNWRISSSEILGYAAAWLSNDDLVFPGIPGPSRSAYVLRAAAIFLANFQARYEDVGTAVSWGMPTHAQRWQELPDL